MDPKELKALLKEAKDCLKSKDFPKAQANCKVSLRLFTISTSIAKYLFVDLKKISAHPQKSAKSLSSKFVFGDVIERAG